VLYHLRDDKEFKMFEEKMLLNNPLFDTFFELDNDFGAYVFDFSDHKSDYKKIINGKYSLLSSEYKRTILNFFKNHSRHHAYVESYLMPARYFNNYADLLAAPADKASMVRLLKNVGELCSLPDLTQEKLTVKEKVINFESIN
jgi:hypothetical protein